MTHKPTLASLLFAVAASISSAAAHEPDTLQGIKTYAIDSIVVTGTRVRTDLRHLPMTVSIIGREELADNYTPSLLPSLTEHIPGLFTTSRGAMGYGVSTGAAGGMSLRGVGGSPTTGLLVLIDGHPQYMGLMGHPIADAYQTMLAERVEVVRGPASVLYGGNAMGGVINIVTRKTRADGIGTNLRAGYGSFNTLQSEIAVDARKERLSGIVTGSYNRTDGHRPDMGFEQYGGYAKVGYELNEHWSAFVDMNLTHFNASNPGAVGAPLLDNDSRITRGMASASLQNRYDRSSGAVNIFYNWGEHRIDDGYPPEGTPLDYRFRSHDDMLGISVYQSISFTPDSRLTAGADYQHFGGRAWNRFLDGSPDKMLADKTMYNLAGYVDYRRSIGNRLTVDAGLRLDRNSNVGSEWIPQAGISFHASRNTDIKAMVSKGFRFPTIREMYMFPPQNPDLKPERLMNYELSLSGRALEGRLSYGLNLYYIDGENMIVREMVEGRPKNVNTGRIINRGFEVNAEGRVGKMWFVTANYSLLDMKYPVLAAPEHKLYGGVNFTSGRLRLSTGVQWVGGLYTSLKPAVQEDFTVWNASVSVRATRSLEIYVRGENLLSERYEINAGYPMPKANFTAGVNLDF